MMLDEPIVEIEVPGDLATQVRWLARLREMPEEDLMREVWEEFTKKPRER